MYKKFIAIIIALTITTSHFAFVAQAQSLVSPGNDGCSTLSEGGSLKIVCTYHGKTTKFKWNGYFKTRELVGIDDLYQVWMTESTEKHEKGGKYVIVSKGAPTDSNEKVTIYYLGFNTYLNQISSFEGSYPLIENTSTVKGHLNLYPWNPLTRKMDGAQSYIICTRGEWGDLRNNSNSDDMAVMDVMIKKMPIENVVRKKKTIDQQQLVKCISGKTGITYPVSDIGGDSKDGLGPFYDDMKNNWLSELNKLPDTENKTKAIKMVNDVFDDRSKLYTKEEDIEVYKKFYDSTYTPDKKYPPGYPTVTVSDELYKQYLEYSEVLNPLAASSNFEGSDYWPVMGQIFKRGGITMDDIDRLPLWSKIIIGVSNPFNRMALFTTEYVTSANARDARNLVKEQVKVFFANLYLRNNLLFNKCMGNEYSGMTNEQIDKMLNNMDDVLEDTYTGLDAYASDDFSVCDEMIQEGNSFLKTIKKAICALLEWLKKDLADKMFNNSVTWLKASLGITDPTKDLDIEEEPIK